jgi:hypothetical protein
MNGSPWRSKGAQKATTKFSQGVADLSDSLLGMIAKQLLVKRSYLDEMLTARGVRRITTASSTKTPRGLSSSPDRLGIKEPAAPC